MECAYFLLTGKQRHVSVAKLDLVREIYQQVMTFTDCKELLTLMPFGHCPGMPISEYFRDFRRAADGYRFNNSDLLARSLTAKIPAYVSRRDDEEWDGEDWDHEDFEDEK